MADSEAPAVPAAAKKRSPPTPPRLTGDYATDSLGIAHWMHEFYSILVVQTGLIDPAFQSRSGVFDASALPDPADTSIARAQQTANEAYQRGRLAPFLFTDFTLENTNNEVTFTFEEKREDQEYRVLVQAVGFSGSPGASAFVVTRVTKTTKTFSVTFAAAPGSGNSVTFECVLFPKG